jgi:hypothetical protein
VKHGDSGADFDVQVTLELARVAREPSLADKQRVFEALQVRLGDLPSLPAAGESTTGVRLVVPKLEPVSIAARFARSLMSSKAAMHVVWVGVATGGFGFWLGAHSAPSAEPTPLQPAARVVPAIIGEPASKPEANGLSVEPLPAMTLPAATLPIEPSPAPPVRAEPSPDATPSAADVKPAPVAPTRPALVPSVAPAPRAQEPRRTARSATPPAVNPAVNPGVRFLEAVRLLSRAQRAIDGGEAAVALVLLEELDERIPRELLGEERDAARAVALCKTGQLDRARAVALELTARSPSSIYAARIERSCGRFDPATSDR